MQLTIDNLDGFGPRDYTSATSADAAPKITRRLNQPSAFAGTLIADNAQFVVPSEGARVILARGDGLKLFTGYLTQAPEFEYLGWGERGPVYRYALAAQSDEYVLDRKMLPARAPFTARTAGAILKQLATDLLPASFDVTGVQDVGVLSSLAVDTEKPWSFHAAQAALRTRSTYRAHDGQLSLAPVGAATHAINESDASFSPDDLVLVSPRKLINDVTVAGRVEPQAHVKDYFLGDGITLRFDLSHEPFTRRNRVLLEDEYKNGSLSPQSWIEIDPSGAVSVSSGRLQVAGGTGSDGQTLVEFVELIELGGAMTLQHGEVTFTAASNAVLGGLYSGAVAIANCVAGFRVTPGGAQSSIQALINGALAGAPITTTTGHRYRLTTRFYAVESFRSQETFYSSSHPSGSGRGGGSIASDVRVVLDVHDIDPANGGSFSADSVVLYDNIITLAPGYCTYALVNALSAQCSIAYSRISRVLETEVRTQIPSQAVKTRLVGSILDGSECITDDTPQLQFYSQYVPPSNTAIAVRYRASGRALARIQDAANIAGNAGGSDDGVRGAVKHVLLPPPRTEPDCENAALALLDDSVQQAWKGSYSAWSDFLPNGPASDIWPGDAVAVTVASRAANFSAIARAVTLTCDDLAGDRSQYKIAFSNDAAELIAITMQLENLAQPLDLTATTVTSGNAYIADVPAAEVTSITSTTVAIDMGAAPPVGGGFEVRLSDSGWSQTEDRNLVGRFTTQTFTLTRFTRLITYYLKQYDNSAPQKYSRYATALQVDYPL
jgi:hypothetical protein